MKKLLILMFLFAMIFSPLVVSAEETGNNELPQTADGWFEYARSQSTASERLGLFVEGYNRFGQDRFIVGINDNARSLLGWATDQHQNNRFNTARERYELILSSPVLNIGISRETNVKLVLANAQKRVTANNINEVANGRSTASERLEFFIFGNEQFPNDSRFAEGINASASSLLSWAKSEHQSRRFSTAIDRYRMILDAPKLRSSIRQETEMNLSLAREGKLLTAANVSTFAASKSTASERLNLYITGHELFPSDNTLVEGINKSASSLLNWTVTQHQNRRYNTAVDRYETIAAAPKLKNEIKLETDMFLYFARQEQRPTGANIASYANAQSSSTERLVLNITGHRLHPNDVRFEEGINNNAASLLRWTSGQHENGNFSTSVERYETILNAPRLNEDIRVETQLRLSLAKNNQRPTANNVNSVASSQRTASERLSYFIVGDRLFSNDTRFREGINTSASSLLTWSVNEHQKRRYNTAILRYETILRAPSLDDNVRLQTEMMLSFARNNQRPTGANIVQYAQKQNNASERLTLYVTGHELYPNDERFLDGINDSAQSLLNWAIRQHENSQFASAIDRYELIINTPGVRNSLLETATINLDLAKRNLTPDRERVQFTLYNFTLSQVLDIQMTVAPQTDGNNRGFIHSSLVDIRGITTGTTVNLREESNTSSGAISVRQGTVLEIIGEVNGQSVGGNTRWYEVRYNNETRYVHSPLLQIQAIVKDTAHIRQLESTRSHSFGTVAKNTVLPLREQSFSAISGNKEWYEVSFTRMWQNAPREQVENFLNPNNHDRFQHLVLSTTVGVSENQLNGILSGKGVLAGHGASFLEAGRLHSVNEVYLIAHAQLETGNGRSALSNGSIRVGEISQNRWVSIQPSNNGGEAIFIVEFIPATANSTSRWNIVRNDNFDLRQARNIRAIYNMYGIGAVDSAPYSRGSVFAYQQGWFTPEESIIGGAQFIGERYIHNSNQQNTLYKMRWNPTRPGTHQYATDIGWAVKQLNTIKRMYEQLENPILHFDIVRYR